MKKKNNYNKQVKYNRLHNLNNRHNKYSKYNKPKQHKVHNEKKDYIFFIRMFFHMFLFIIIFRLCFTNIINYYYKILRMLNLLLDLFQIKLNLIKYLSYIYNLLLNSFIRTYSYIQIMQVKLYLFIFMIYKQYL